MKNKINMIISILGTFSGVIGVVMSIAISGIATTLKVKLILALAASIIALGVALVIVVKLSDDLGP